MTDGRRCIEDWFAARGWSSFAFQREAWDAWAGGECTLIHAATGTGKTLAAWFGPLAGALDAGEAERESDTPPPIRLLWVTPLRALAADTLEQLRSPVAELGLDWTVDLRTADTAQSARARQRRRLPTALVTTPESLSLLLSYAETRRQLTDSLETVVVDEWHELLGNKRGTLLELGLAHLRAANPRLRVQGLSATLANPGEALEVLSGPGRPGRLIRGHDSRDVEIESVCPEPGERFPWTGHLGLHLLDAVVERLDAPGSSLVFTNTRSQAEQWFAAIQRARPDWVGTVALHHGSLDKDLRRRVEAGLKDGTIRRVVATSSLDLGVDFTPVDRVFQIGSPGGVGRLLQRAGRSGHAPGRTSVIHCVPTHALELLEIAGVRRALSSGRVEARRPLRLCLDVLAQHLVTLAVGGGFRAGAVHAEIENTVGYRGLGPDLWQWVLDFVTRGGECLTAYPDFQRVEIDPDGLYRVRTRRIAQRHRMAVGTIGGDAAIEVRFVRGERLGSVEERFIARLRPGDAFSFAGRSLELVRIRALVAEVRLASPRRAVMPRWQGGRLPLSAPLADEMLSLLAEYGRESPAIPERAPLAPILELQRKWSALPMPGRLLVEVVRSREGVHLLLYPFAGHLAHEGLAAWLAWRLTRTARLTLHTAVNDYGLELVGRGFEPPDAAGLRSLLEPERLEGEIEDSLNATDLARHQFRDIARIAGLVFAGYPGRAKTARQLQASSGLMFDVLNRHDAGNPLLHQARREVVEEQLGLERLRTALTELRSAEIVLRHPPRLTPMAFPLWSERTRQRVSSESWTERVRRMADRLEQAAGQ